MPTPGAPATIGASDTLNQPAVRRTHQIDGRPGALRQRSGGGARVTPSQPLRDRSAHPEQRRLASPLAPVSSHRQGQASSHGRTPRRRTPAHDSTQPTPARQAPGRLQMAAEGTARANGSLVSLRPDGRRASQPVERSYDENLVRGPLDAHRLGASAPGRGPDLGFGHVARPRHPCHSAALLEPSQAPQAERTLSASLRRPHIRARLRPVRLASPGRSRPDTARTDRRRPPDRLSTDLMRRIPSRI